MMLLPLTRSWAFFMLNRLQQAATPKLLFKLYPTGEFSATRVRTTPTLGMEDIRDAYADAAAYLCEKCKDPGRPTAKFVVSKLSTLGSSNVPNSHTDSKPRGRRGMTRYNKRLIVNSVTLLERKYGRKHLSFITLTLPPECESAASELYGEAKRQMLQWLKRHLAASLLPSSLIGCTELQGSRFTNTGAFALHEHWVCVGRQPYSSWSVTPKALQSAWLGILSNVYKVGISESHSRAACRIESIHKSASAYLGKYMGKSAKVTQQAIEAGLEDCLPHSWVTKTKAMLAMFRESIVSISGEKAIFLSDSLREFRDVLCRWSKDLFIEFNDGGEAWLGFVGYLNQEGFRFLSLTGT